MIPKLRVVKHGSPEYLECVQLRREVLRWPLGLDFSDEQLQQERDDIHLGAFEGAACIGCLVLTPIVAGSIQMRQVAVRPDLQGHGIGRLLVEESERIARDRGFRRMVLHARESAVAFYLRLGYEVEGEPFEEVTIPHLAMARGL